ncbi:Glutamine--tRNA ligase [compost metagenome]
MFEPLITDEAEEEDKPFLECINPQSLEVLQGFVEPNMKDASGGDKFQFFRHGYFNVDPKDSTDEKLVFNRIVSLKSSFNPSKA